MRRNNPTVLFLVVAASALGIREGWSQAQPRAPQGNNAPAQAAPKAPAPDPDPDGKRIKQILSFWEQKSSQAFLKTLDTSIERFDNDPAWGIERFKGRAILKSPDLAFLDFQKVKIDDKTGKETTTPDDRIICTGTEVWHYKSPTKQVFIYPLEKDRRQRALEEGPLPFLFNMKVAEAEKRYEMKLRSETKDAFVVHVLPLLKIDKESFRDAWLQLSWIQRNDQDYLLPTKIKLIGPDGKSSKLYILKIPEIKPNVAVNPENFKGRVYPGWKAHRNPMGDEQAGDAPAEPRVRGKGVLRGRRLE